MIYSAEYHDLYTLLPPLQNLGLRVIDQIQFTMAAHEKKLHIRKFLVTPAAEQAHKLSEHKTFLLQALQALFAEQMDDDALNELILLTGLDWKMIDVIRAYCNYYLQINKRFERVRVHRALLDNFEVLRLLCRYFEARFSPDESLGGPEKRETEGFTLLRSELIRVLEKVTDLVEDRILRDIFNLIDATLRTNFFRRLRESEFFVSLKISSLGVINMPNPRPLVEIYVHARSIEGVHLRGARVARGGIRWSDRPDDFRAEVLGLMRTQMMKNALIVPQGAKGGFIVKSKSTEAESRARLAQGAYCNFMRGLLDLTDNVRGADVIRPPQVIAYDDADPYLVVAADKGTAGFSDRANEIAAEYSYWLGDSFATGGSHGFHHKKLGITARGAWICVKRHFRELDTDVDLQAITVVGVGGMEGDVFGNGMLQSSNIRLLAAFNAEYIFLDPDPDRGASFAERKRLFETPGTTWEDYNPALISAGGGVFRRSSKDILLSAEVRRWLGARNLSMDGEELVRLILTAPVDLIWMGGVGTYVRASSETDESVGDRANDGARVQASQIRARVVGEGANLGLTQRARIEYALTGGRVNTDAVDNSAGVDLSDHEVNLKILLASHESGPGLDISNDERNRVLVEVSDEVCRLVLNNNYQQSLCLSLERERCRESVFPFLDLADQLVNMDLLDRSMESFPTRKEAISRGALGLTRPELAVLMAYAKLALKRALLDAPQVSEEEWIRSFVFEYFPTRVRTRYADRLRDHLLAREISITVICNKVIDQAGVSFLAGMEELDPFRVREAVGLYLAFDQILQGDRWREAVRALDGKLTADRQYELLLQLESALSFLCRWAWEHGRRLIPVPEIIEAWRADLRQYLVYLGQSPEFTLLTSAAPEASRLLFLNRLRDFPALVNLSRNSSQSLASVAKAFDDLLKFLGLRQIVTLVSEVKARDLWERRLQTALDDQFRSATGRLVRMELHSNMADPEQFFHEFALEPRLARFLKLRSELVEEPLATLEPFAALAAELESLTDACGAAAGLY